MKNYSKRKIIFDVLTSISILLCLCSAASINRVTGGTLPKITLICIIVSLCLTAWSIWRMIYCLLIVPAKAEKRIRKYHRENLAQLKELAERMRTEDNSTIKLVRSTAPLRHREQYPLANGCRLDSDNKVSEDDITFYNKMTGMLSEWDVRSVEGMWNFKSWTFILRIAFDPKICLPSKELWFVDNPNGPKFIYGEGVKKQVSLAHGWYLVTLDWVPAEE